jgi:hypothetical protein
MMTTSVPAIRVMRLLCPVLNTQRSFTRRQIPQVSDVYVGKSKCWLVVVFIRPEPSSSVPAWFGREQFLFIPTPVLSGTKSVCYTPAASDPLGQPLLTLLSSTLNPVSGGTESALVTFTQYVV